MRGKKRRGETNKRKEKNRENDDCRNIKTHEHT